MADIIPGMDFEKPVIEMEQKIEELKNTSATKHVDFSKEIENLEHKCEKLKKKIFANLTPWQKVQLARHPRRPLTLEYIHLLTTDFMEMHGDRNFGDDNAIVGGIAKLGKKTVVVLGHQKGRTTEENLNRNFGMAHPEGYRKALRLMKFAEKFSFPIIVFIDTSGAYPGVGAEERGQAEAIARNLKIMAELTVPIVVIVTGEGGSGGALGIGVGDRILMLENAIYSVISPEGCASILWHDASKAPEAARALKLTAIDLYGFKIIDDIIPEPLGGIHRNIEFVKEPLASKITAYIEELQKLSTEELTAERYAKFRRMGEFMEGAVNKRGAKKNSKK